MNVRRLAVALFVFTFSLFAVSQDSLSAEAVLARMRAQNGWVGGSILDAVASGNSISDDGSVQSLRVSQRGSRQSKVELGDAADMTVTIVNGYVGKKLHNGSPGKLASSFGASSITPFLPMLSIDVVSGHANLTLKGQQEFGTETAVGVEIAPKVLPNDKFAGLRLLGEPITLWISTATHQLLAIDYVRLATDNPSVRFHFRRLYSDYRRISGIAIPFQQTVLVENTPLSTVQFQEVRLNVGLSDSDFQVGDGQ